MRIAVVTGASSGIGAELVRQLRGQGWHTVALSRRPADADEHEECDVSNRASVDAAAARVLERHPRIDLLVNNAGIPANARGFLDVEPESLERATATNFLGGAWVTRAFLPGLQPGAHVVNVVSVAGEVADGPYSATKHAQLALSRSLAVELAPRGISVLTVKPGLVVDPPFVARRIIDGVEHDRREITVPRWYRPAAVLQAVIPATLARVRARTSR